MAYEFDAVLIRPEGTGTWTYLDVPFDSAEAFGSKGQIRVKGTLNGLPFSSTLLANGRGQHYLVVKKEIRRKLGVEAGSIVRVVLEADGEERRLDVPGDVLAALEGQPAIRQIFEKMAPSHQKEYLEYIGEAKQAATRQRRINRMLEDLGKKTGG